MSIKEMKATNSLSRYWKQFLKRNKHKNKRYKKKTFYEKHETTITFLYSHENDDLVNMINSTKKILAKME